MPESESNESVPAIDDSIRRLAIRIHNINGNLHDGLFGEQPESPEDKDAIAIPSSSLASIARRVKEIHESLNTTENYVSNIHKQTPTKVG